ncbi:hypothetical protein CKAH01_17217 [Colletotrichum kahawae]|uniref:Uncharacterized protein n=1 Tax=Colletotrichum kahawae TaxID=34407 RepID=A0AAD9YD18_COLKA|nr:hypothetical protein CKAH01_17217 [Colletotrichum kahawae]
MFAMDPMEIPPLIADTWDKGGGLDQATESVLTLAPRCRAHTDKGTESAGLYPRRDESRQSPAHVLVSVSLSFSLFCNEAKWGSSLHQLGLPRAAGGARTDTRVWLDGLALWWWRPSPFIHGPAPSPSTAQSDV